MRKCTRSRATSPRIRTIFFFPHNTLPVDTHRHPSSGPLFAPHTPFMPLYFCLLQRGKNGAKVRPSFVTPRPQFFVNRTRDKPPLFTSSLLTCVVLSALINWRSNPSHAPVDTWHHSHVLLAPCTVAPHLHMNRAAEEAPFWPFVGAGRYVPFLCRPTSNYS
jgi:hypothetical protein